MFELDEDSMESAGAMIGTALAATTGFILANGLDRLLATVDPSSSEKPLDKFTSGPDGAGTLANTLNVAAMPNWKRIAAGVGVTAAPAIGAALVDEDSVARGALEGAAVGAGISLFKTLWDSVLMPALVGRDTSTPALQKSYVARLYPAEVAAHINRQATPPTTAVSSSGSGALSDGVPRLPAWLGGDSPYASADQALREHAMGLHGDSPYSSAADALRAGAVAGDSPYASAADALRAGVGAEEPAWQPAGPPEFGPGPQARPHKDCGCVGDPTSRFSAFLGAPPKEEPLVFPWTVPIGMER